MAEAAISRASALLKLFVGDEQGDMERISDLLWKLFGQPGSAALREAQTQRLEDAPEVPSEEQQQHRQHRGDAAARMNAAITEAQAYQAYAFVWEGVY